MSSPAQESFLSFDDGKIHVCQDGPRDAPALLLIHGTAVSARSWDPMVPFLADAHHVIRIDLLGCGRSAKPRDASYAVANQARRAAAVLDRLGVARAVVAGHSSGGTVATSLAEQRPGLVSAVVLINTGPDMAAYLGEDTGGAAAPADLSDEQLRQAMSTGFAPGYRIPRSLVDQFRDIDLHTFAETSRAVRAYLDERSLPDRLAPLGKPLLVLFGEEDRRWRPSSAADYRAVPGATIRLLPGCGHSPNIEDPARTAAHLLTVPR
ncbi:alpha/beta fold hydrolase [Amycolatopsis albispora]|uniref:Alpha/beta hydrolase n=1 Tax=Amycolatopsis albispora TaxID=1804986 RepID=A0A344L5K4_9PSEU|nr:alpha/beta fold hydrolase [Amycolatopsis albispora]AXB43328.1 alpha/beta hydrolase [Amycolatopsis albispora]